MMWLILVPLNILFFLGLSEFCFFTVSFNHCLDNHLYKHAVFLCLSSCLYHFIHVLSIEFSVFFCRRTYYNQWKYIICTFSSSLYTRILILCICTDLHVEDFEYYYSDFIIVKEIYTKTLMGKSILFRIWRVGFWIWSVL